MDCVSKSMALSLLYFFNIIAKYVSYCAKIVALVSFELF